LHDNGFFFMPKIYNALKKQGISLSYSADSWAVQFYRRWLQYPTWNLKQAAKIYLGDDPDGGRSFESFANTALHGSGMGFSLLSEETFAEYDHNGEYIPPPDSVEYIWNDEPDPHASRYLLESYVRSHIDAYHISPVRDDGPGQLYFRPKVIVEFFRDYLNRTFRPQALYIAMGIDDLSRNTTPNSPATRGRKRGSGEKDDVCALEKMHALLTRQDGMTRHAAALQVANHLGIGHSLNADVKRYMRKYKEKYE
jgi:hypothetical protein